MKATIMIFSHSFEVDETTMMKCKNRAANRYQKEVDSTLPIGALMSIARQKKTDSSRVKYFKDES